MRWQPASYMYINILSTTQSYRDIIQARMFEVLRHTQKWLRNQMEQENKASYNYLVSEKLSKEGFQILVHSY